MKKNLSILIITMITMLVLCSCGEITGSELFDLHHSESVVMQIGDISYSITELDYVNDIKDYLSRLKLQKIETEPKEGGITLSFKSGKDITVITICEKKILYKEQWYQSSENISDELSKYKNSN